MVRISLCVTQRTVLMIKIISFYFISHILKLIQCELVDSQGVRGDHVSVSGCESLKFLNSLRLCMKEITC